jgi:hypothetical protein
MFFHPRINGGISLYSAVESQQFGSHRHVVLSGTCWFQGSTLSSYSMGSPNPSARTPSWRNIQGHQSAMPFNVMI